MALPKNNIFILSFLLGLICFVESNHALAQENSTDWHYEVFLQVKQLEKIFLTLETTVVNVREHALLFCSEARPIFSKDTTKASRVKELDLKVETSHENLATEGVNVDKCVQLYQELVNNASATTTENSFTVFRDYFNEHIGGIYQVRNESVEMAKMVQKLKLQAFACEENDELCFSKVLQNLKEYSTQIDESITQRVNKMIASIPNRANNLYLQARTDILTSLLELDDAYIKFNQCVFEVQNKKE